MTVIVGSREIRAATGPAAWWWVYNISHLELTYRLDEAHPDLVTMSINDGLDDEILDPPQVEIETRHDVDDIWDGGSIVRSLVSRYRAEIRLLWEQPGPPSAAPWRPRGFSVMTWGGDVLRYVDSHVQMPRYWNPTQPRQLTEMFAREAARAARLTSRQGGKTSLSRHVLPEAEVIDEIDRLVNTQIQRGPVDDYNADRYDKCAACCHDWHGLECVHCDCINTDWLKAAL